MSADPGRGPLGRVARYRQGDTVKSEHGSGAVCRMDEQCAGKVKGEYGYDSWQDLISKRPKPKIDKSDPNGGLQDMLKDMSHL